MNDIKNQLCCKMDKYLLKFVQWFNPLFKRQGLDMDRMYSIVETKLMMDKRRVNMQWKQKQQKENTNHLNRTLFFYALLGAFVGFMVVAIPSLIMSMTFLHSYLIFMMAMTLITDFSSVLLDTTDNQVILPRPVSSKTLFMARLLHILIYLLQFTIALSIGPLIGIIYTYGLLTGFVFLFTALLSILLAVFLTYFLYLAMLRFANEQKIKDIITGFQIVMTILFAVGFQILPRMIDFAALSDNFNFNWYYYLLPPFWMAYTLQAIHDFNFNGQHLLMMAMAFTLPAFLFWILNKYLAPGFAKKLEAMQTDSSPTIKTNNGNLHKKTISARLSALCCQGGEEKAGFEFTWKLTGREKSFKLQFYPSMSYLLVFLVIFFMKSDKSISVMWSELAASKSYVWFIYLPMFGVSGSILIVAFNENFSASWIFHSLPVVKPGAIITGSIKSLFVKFFLPVYLLAYMFSFYVWGWGITVDFIFGFLNNSLLFLTYALVLDHYLPFSRQPSTQQQTGKVLLVFMQLIIVAVLVGLHYLLIGKPIILYSLIPFLAAACWWLLHKLRNLPWNKIAV